MLTYFFPGQGSQKKGMGSDLFQDFPEQVAIADRVLGYSITELCIEDPREELNLTQFTQPALYVVNALTYLKKMKDGAPRPDFLAGHSLGEYNALFAGGAFDFETGLRLVQKRGQLMGEAEGGGMAAVVGIPEEKVREVLTASGAASIDIANFNSPQQIVLSGPSNDILELKASFQEAGVRMYMPLKVSAAFHSRYMKPASEAFRSFLSQFQFQPLQIPVISNVEARPYGNDRIGELLSAQIVSSVRWTETIRYLMGKGCTQFEEVGPGKVLAGLYKKISTEAEPLILEDEVAPQPGVVQSGPDAAAHTSSPTHSLAQSLGSRDFRESYGLQYAYMAGAMGSGISSTEMVVNLAKAGCLGSFGTHGLSLEAVSHAIRHLKMSMPKGVSFAMNLVNDADQEKHAEALVDLFLREGISLVEAANFIQMTSGLVRYRLSGCYRDTSGKVVARHRIIAKATRPEVAKAFMSPAPQRLVEKLRAAGFLSEAEAALAPHLPMADDVIAQADGGWYTDQSLAFALLPALASLRGEMARQHGYPHYIRLGAAGGIGTPAAVAAAFILGADFMVTGSVNQATVEADTSAAAKELLQNINVQDTDYAPAGDMFELGAKVQVLKRGVFFPARANKLFDLYRNFNALEDLDEKTRTQLEERFFKRSFKDIWQDLKRDMAEDRGFENAERNPKAKMALVFKWYFQQGLRLAKEGNEQQKVDFQIFCGPALGAFNQWVKGTPMEAWQQRRVAEIAMRLMQDGAALLQQKLKDLASFA